MHNIYGLCGLALSVLALAPFDRGSGVAGASAAELLKLPPEAHSEVEPAEGGELEEAEVAVLEADHSGGVQFFYRAPRGDSGFYMCTCVGCGSDVLMGAMHEAVVGTPFVPHTNGTTYVQQWERWGAPAMDLLSAEPRVAKFSKNQVFFCDRVDGPACIAWFLQAWVA